MPTTNPRTWPDAHISRVGAYRLVHLDSPDDATVADRDRMVADGSFFDDDCPICQAQKKAGGDIVFEPDWDGALVPDDHAGDPLTVDPANPAPLWKRTYLDLETLDTLPPREHVHALATAIVFCLLEIVDDVSLLGQLERWGDSLKYYCAQFARFSPALSGTDRLIHGEDRNLGAMVFQLRSYLGWFAESVPVLEAKVADLDSTASQLLAALRRFDEEAA